MQNQNYLTNKYRDTIKNIVTRCDRVDEDYSTFDGKNIKSLRKDLLSDEYISSGDLNEDSYLNILDIVQLVNIILNN